ncbi:MAG: metallophosphoesterase family protein [Methyloligellaceae bacterium]
MAGAPSVPEGRLVYAIGDIHGRSDLLAQLLRDIRNDAAAHVSATRRTLVFLGDYVDRGPDSRGVIEILISGLPDGFDAIFLMGNHEWFLIDFLKRPEVLSHWMYNGAAATLSSYGLPTSASILADAEPNVWRDQFAAALPPSHHTFLVSLELTAVIGDYVFVHAGLRPGVPIDRQDPKDLLWIREPFLEAQDGFAYMVVHGHTPGARPVIRENRIGIDTGACMTGRLTALRLFASDRAFLMTPEERGG